MGWPRAEMRLLGCFVMGTAAQEAVATSSATLALEGGFPSSTLFLTRSWELQTGSFLSPFISFPTHCLFPVF